MLKLAKYLKPYLLLIVLAIGLLFVQANADLALPDYLAKIVNNGIQLSGIENAVPIAIRQSTMDKITLFTSTEDKTSILNDYLLVTPDSPNAQEYLDKYPAIANEPIYVLQSIDQAEIDRLNPILAKPLLTVFSIEQVMADPAKLSAMAQGAGIDLSRLPPGMDLFSALRNMPEAQRASIISQVASFADQRMGTLNDKMLVQAAALAIKSEYTALGMDLAKFELNYLLRVGGIMLALTLLSGASTILVSYLAAKTASGVGRDVRKAVFTKVEEFSSAEFDKFSTTSLITRSTNDITQIQMVTFMLLRMVIYAPIIGIGAIIHAFRLDTSMWWIIAVAVGALLTLVITIMAIALPKFKIVQKLTDRLNLVMRENLSGMMVIRAFNRQDFELNRFDKANKEITSVLLFIGRSMVILMPVMFFIMNGVTVLIIWIGAHQVSQANMQVGDVIAFMQYTIQVVFSFLMMSMMFIILPGAVVSAGRIGEVLETDPVIKDPAQPKRFSDRFDGTVEFRNVSFRYPDAEEDILHDISFVARPGQTTAFIGSTGSGKSTVVNLIPRFYDVTSGSIMIDGIDIRQVTQHDLREKIGYIPQKGVLFSGTIESNLRYADENASLELLREATDIAQATDFVSNNGNNGHDGFDAEISQGGTNVSGGQKQRLSIARALVKKPPIYIFDDSFSAVDFKTDAALRRALKNKTSDSTLLIVTQRVSTIKNAEQIIVLDEGRIIAKGTHQELMRDCQDYQEIALSQLSQEELR